MRKPLFSIFALLLLLAASSASADSCARLLKGLTRPIVIGVAGGSASGKTTLAKKLVALFDSPDVQLVTQDWYFLPFEQPKEYWINGHINFDHPTAMDIPLMRQHLKILREGGGVVAPDYDYPTGRRIPEARKVGPLKVIVFEGIHALGDPELRDMMDLKVFVDIDEARRLARRLRRDSTERGQPVEKILRWYYKMVKPMHDKFVQPSKEHADVVVGGDDVDKAAKEVIERIERGRLAR